MEIDKLKEKKEAALAHLREAVPAHAERLAAVDSRLLTYCEGVAANEPDTHNLYEVLGVVRFLRLLDDYPYDTDKVRRVIRTHEGEWRDGQYIPGTGGLKFTGMEGPTRYQMTPFQVYMYALLYGPHCYVPTGQAAGSRPLSDTETVNPEDGMIYDLRRLCTEFTLFCPRKVGKTEEAAFVATEFMMFGDYNAEIYCTANSQDQSKILFRRTMNLLRQLDPSEKRIRFTASEMNWRPGQMRAASITALSAGGKTKDGLFAQLCCADEFGSAYYVKNHSDMADLVNVVTGSMGPRREPLLLITTTAGNNIEGPFQQKLDGLKRLLSEEV